MQNQTPYSTSPSSRPPTANTSIHSVSSTTHTSSHPHPGGPNQRDLPYDPYPPQPHHTPDLTQTQEEDYLSDMQPPDVTQSQMEEGAYGAREQFYLAEEGEYDQHQQDGQAEYNDQPHPPYTSHGTHHQYTQHGDYRGPTPESEVGDGALTIWKNVPADQGEYGPEGYRINQYATQGMMGDREGGERILQPQASVRQQDYVEEPASPMGTFQSTQYQNSDIPQQPQLHLPAQKVASVSASKPFHPPGPSTKSGNTDPTNQGSSGSSSKRKNEEAHVGTENIAGRRVLTRRSGSKRDFFPSMEEGEEEERRVEKRAAAVEEFDPTAEIIKFDTKKELVEEWLKIQGDIVPFLEKYCADKLNNTYNEIYLVLQLFQQLNDDARKDLTVGVAAIQEEEVQQEKARKVIVDFATAMQEVADKLASFGGGGITGLPSLDNITGGAGGAVQA